MMDRGSWKTGSSSSSPGPWRERSFSVFEGWASDGSPSSAPPPVSDSEAEAEVTGVTAPAGLALKVNPEEEEEEVPLVPPQMPPLLLLPEKRPPEGGGAENLTPFSGDHVLSPVEGKLLALGLKGWSCLVGEARSNILPLHLGCSSSSSGSGSSGRLEVSAFLNGLTQAGVVGGGEGLSKMLASTRMPVSSGRDKQGRRNLPCLGGTFSVDFDDWTADPPPRTEDRVCDVVDLNGAKATLDSVRKEKASLDTEMVHVVTASQIVGTGEWDR